MLGAWYFKRKIARETVAQLARGEQFAYSLSSSKHLKKYQARRNQQQVAVF